MALLSYNLIWIADVLHPENALQLKYYFTFENVGYVKSVPDCPVDRVYITLKKQPVWHKLILKPSLIWVWFEPIRVSCFWVPESAQIREKII